jgi:hypothetical protein
VTKGKPVARKYLFIRELRKKEVLKELMNIVHQHGIVDILTVAKSTDMSYHSAVQLLNSAYDRRLVANGLAQRYGNNFYIYVYCSPGDVRKYDGKNTDNFRKIMFPKPLFPKRVRSQS